jgi:hypothetical protein
VASASAHSPRLWRVRTITTRSEKAIAEALSFKFETSPPGTEAIRFNHIWGRCIQGGPWRHGLINRYGCTPLQSITVLEINEFPPSFLSNDPGRLQAEHGALARIVAESALDHTAVVQHGQCHILGQLPLRHHLRMPQTSQLLTKTINDHSNNSYWPHASSREACFHRCASFTCLIRFALTA